MELSQLLPCGYLLAHQDQLDSTNEEARRIITSGAVQEKLVILTDKQHRGRGRGGREWVSEHGNFYVSFIHELVGEKLSNGYALAAGLSIRETILHYLPTKDIKWKWPNDVLLEGGKVSGVLLEHVSQCSKNWLITGVGINLLSAPNTGALWKTTSLAAHSSTAPTRDELLKTFVKYLDFNYKRVAAGEVAALAQDCLKHAAGLGDKIQVRLPLGTLDGIFDGLDNEGNLLLSTEASSHKISAGDVFLTK